MYLLTRIKVDFSEDTKQVPGVVARRCREDLDNVLSDEFPEEEFYLKFDGIDKINVYTLNEDNELLRDDVEIVINANGYMIES